MNKKNNQRFRETEIRMESAMLELMKTMEFEKITVKKICEQAQVNRSTFYAHFIDIYDMLDKMEKELRKELLESYDTKDNLIFSKSSFINFLKHIKKHKYFYKINLQNRKSFPLQQGYEPLMAIIKEHCYRAGIIDNDEIMYYFIYFQAGFTMTLKHWVDTNCKLSEAEIATIIENCLPAVLVNRKEQEVN
ncbi:TetR/AcrR family transcriptional regulator [uncultured Thomasclavelia sp.]|uniref:TetR/AcrR family transcriptional regulator n=1 Tax=uncultured Thomasclavelia sp. TaxID=3025759 RepID=UPI0025F855EE|nr:TetR/AcrR family transcriptional regulator [uncultured Thomasclavelia sp.]